MVATAKENELKELFYKVLVNKNLRLVIELTLEELQSEFRPEKKYWLPTTSKFTNHSDIRGSIRGRYRLDIG